MVDSDGVLVSSFSGGVVPRVVIVDPAIKSWPATTKSRDCGPGDEAALKTRLGVCVLADSGAERVPRDGLGQVSVGAGAEVDLFFLKKDQRGRPLRPRACRLRR